MSMAVSLVRWQEAQRAEQSYWDEVIGDAEEFARTLAEKVQAAQWWSARIKGGMPDGDWVEIGIGPLGVGCVQFLADAARRSLVGVEPLPPQRTASGLPPPLAAAVRACRSADYTQIRAPGEDTGLQAGRFGLVVCYNVLDHVRHPEAIVRETWRLLRPGGLLLLGCDTVSALSLLRFHIWVRRRHAGSIGVRAHPFRFFARDLIAMTERSGFRLIADNRRRPHWWHEAAGHAHRLLLLCEKPRRLEAVG